LQKDRSIYQYGIIPALVYRLRIVRMQFASQGGLDSSCHVCAPTGCLAPKKNSNPLRPFTTAAPT